MRRSSKTSMHIVNFTTPTSNGKPFRHTFTCSDNDRSRRNSPISKLVPLPVFEVQKNRLRCRPFSKLPSASVQAGQSPTTATATAASTRNARPCAPAAHRADLRQRKWGEQHIHLVTEGRSCSLLLPLLQYIALDWKNWSLLSFCVSYPGSLSFSSGRITRLTADCTGWMRVCRTRSSYSTSGNVFYSAFSGLGHSGQ